MLSKMEQDFVAFVMAQPDRRTVQPWNNKACIGYQFLKAASKPVLSCGITEWRPLSRDVVFALPPLIAETISRACDLAHGFADEVSWRRVKTIVRRLLKEGGHADVP